MSVKPIQDELEVKEVGSLSSANKGQVDSQSLPIPPMTVNQFQDFVSSVVEDIIKVDKPVDNVVVSQLGPETQRVDFDSVSSVSASVNEFSSNDAVSSETPVTDVPPVVLDATEPTKETTAEQDLSDIEGRVADLLAKIGVASEAKSSGSSGLTTRDYVDTVLGGERNLEGENLVKVGNFLGEEEGITFSQNEDGTFDISQDGEVIGDNISREDANSWITNKEQGEAAKGTVEDEVKETDTNSVETEKDGKIIQETDNSTSAHRPFHFDPDYMIYFSGHSMTFKQHLYDIVAQNSSSGYWYLECTVDSSLRVTDCEIKTDKSWVANNIEGYCTFETNSNDVDVQTKFEFPIATEFDGEINLISTGGFYEPIIYCLSGTPAAYLTKIS